MIVQLIAVLLIFFAPAGPPVKEKAMAVYELQHMVRSEIGPKIHSGMY